MYSLDNTEVLNKCRVDSRFMGEVIIANENLIWFSIRKYVGNVDMLVRKYKVDKDDLLQLGRVGLVKSINKFDITQKVKFSSFAVTVIVREIKVFLRDFATTIRPSRSAVLLISKICTIEDQLGYMPTIEYLSEILGEDKSKVMKALQIGIGNTIDDQVIFTLTSEENLEQRMIEDMHYCELIASIECILDDEELTVFTLLLEYKNQSEIAKILSRSQAHISRVVKRLRKLIAKKIDL